MAHLTVAREDAQLHVRVWDGPREAVPLVLVHGFGSSAAAWAHNAAALAAERTVVAYDLRGHGATRARAEPSAYTRDAAVADGIAILDALGIRRAALGGLSLGGYLSLATYARHPGRVAALVLCDTGPGFRRDDARERWNRFARAQAEAIERGGAAALRGGPETEVPQDDHEGLALAARGLLAQHDALVIEVLPSIRVPTLVVVGERDEAFLDAARYLAAKVPGAIHAAIADAGHAVNVDQPGVFDGVVRGFLRSVDDAEAAVAGATGGSSPPLR